MNSKIVFLFLMLAIVALVGANPPSYASYGYRVAPVRYMAASPYRMARTVAVGYTPGNNVVSYSSSGPALGLYRSVPMYRTGYMKKCLGCY